MVTYPSRAAGRAAQAHIACIVPMYNEGGHARRFLAELHACVAALFREVTIIVVDDGSQDETAQEVRTAIDQGLPVDLVRLSRNFGKEVALTAGLAAADQLHPPLDAALTIDADFQHPFTAIPAMVQRWEQGVEMVYGVQVRRGTESALRRALKWMFYRLLRPSSNRFTIPRDAGDFRLLDRRVIRALCRLPERSRYMKGLFAWVGFSSEGVPFETLPRQSGRSSFSMSRLTELGLDGLTAFTAWPLRVASYCGLFISFVAFVYGSWIVFERLWIGQPIPGFATLAAAIMLFSGIQLLSIGLLGEYLARVFQEVKGRPLYIVAEEVRARDRAPEAPAGAGQAERRRDASAASRASPAATAEPDDA